MFQRTEQKVDLAATASSVKDTMNKTVTNVKKMNIFSLASAGILAVALILAVIGLTGPMYSREEPNPLVSGSVTDVRTPVKYKNMVFLFKTTVRAYNIDDDYVDKNDNRWCWRLTGKIVPGDPDSEKHCNKDEDMWMAAYAFGIIGVVCIGVALVTTLGSELLPTRVPRLSSPVFIILAWIALIISWAIAVAKYSNSPLCEDLNSRFSSTSAPAPDRSHDIDYGLALLITAWCFISIAFCVNVGGLVMSMMGKKGETTATNQVHPAPVPAPATQLSDVAPPAEAAAEVNQPSAVAN